ncbi:hypothetical protein M409DRAFT_23966 [Zasmidium cellare ATCC 36951]|uniref:SnoaL-like domain-containing protein n=1 Tax=Zasmidium cellare ATCC 36951 TaxID=1080233 RepID=A0A6A6CJR8_ZASCE|nr:uncharacterized protein M409DRAFT_23966 [Zasmidium cellare ATCC 36951]KAF2165676.1 hypothetical protein M409DRAFT_23966 [Zasmidium cellare ATCC 36951]
MASKDTIQQLINRRNELLQKASETRNVNDLIKWYSKDATFCNVYQNLTITGTQALREFYTSAYTAIPTFKITSAVSTGTAEFVASELDCQGMAGVALPQMGIQKGASFKLKGVSLFWWRWDGEGEEWGGGLDEESVKGWKIVRENAYHQVVE